MKSLMVIFGCVACVSSCLAAKTAVQKPHEGFFSVKQIKGVWWIVDANGKNFYSTGVCSIQPEGDIAPSLGYAPYHRNCLAKYGDDQSWAAETAKRMKAWGFNTRGAWSTYPEGVPYFKIMDFSSGHWVKGSLPDYFSKSFIESADQVASEKANPNDTNLVAYFTDNELQWETDWRLGPSIFDRYMALPADSEGKAALRNFFQAKYGEPQKMAAVWSPELSSWDEFGGITKLTPKDGVLAKQDREAWVLTVARQYFKVTTQAIKKHDLNHLIAGCRFTSWTAPAAAVQACGEYCDIISINHYEIGVMGAMAFAAMRPSVTVMKPELSFGDYYKVGKKPLLITEFGFRADDSGLPNSHPDPSLVQPTVPTQLAKGQKYAQWVTTWAKQPYFVGSHWFKYMDEPKEGRFDGENGNYGLVNINDDAYLPFVKQVTAANAKLVSLHSASLPAAKQTNTHKTK